MIVIGHRGARGLAPENTLISLKKAISHDVDEIEFDLRVTKDNVVILHHDKDLIDPNGMHHKIAKCNYKELLNHKKDLATLNDVLSELKGTVPLYIEIKSGVPTKPIISILREGLNDGWKISDFRVASFSIQILQEIKKAFPDIQLIVNETWSGVRAGHRARSIGSTRVSMSKLWLWSGFIRAADKGGMKLTTYTLNNPKKAKKWAKYGLYGVVTDYPDRYQKKA